MQAANESAVVATIGELATAMEIDPGALTVVVDEFNRSAHGGQTASRRLPHALRRTPSGSLSVDHTRRWPFPSQVSIRPRSRTGRAQ